MIIPPGHVLRSAYVPTDEIVFPLDGSTMATAALEPKMREASAVQDGTAYPLPVGKWIDGRFHLWDGRHRYIVALMTGRKTMLVAWVEGS